MAPGQRPQVKCLVNVHAKPPLTPSIRRIDRQQSVRWAAHHHQGRGSWTCPLSARSATDRACQETEPRDSARLQRGCSPRVRPGPRKPGSPNYFIVGRIAVQMHQFMPGPGGQGPPKCLGHKLVDVLPFRWGQVPLTALAPTPLAATNAIERSAEAQFPVVRSCGQIYRTTIYFWQTLSSVKGEHHATQPASLATAPALAGRDVGAAVWHRPAPGCGAAPALAGRHVRRTRMAPRHAASAPRRNIPIPCHQLTSGSRCRRPAQTRGIVR